MSFVRKKSLSPRLSSQMCVNVESKTRGLKQVGNLHALVGYDAVGPTRLELANNLTVPVDFDAT